MKLYHVFAGLVGLIAGALLLPAQAQAQDRKCQITATSQPAVANYDPFNPTALSINAVQMSFVRTNTAGGAKPSTIDMYVTAGTPAANGIELIPTSVVGAGSATGLNQDIFYGTNEPEPNIVVPLGTTPVPGVLRWDYSGNNTASDTFVVTFSVSLPPNLDLTSSSELVFNIEYGCEGTGGGQPFGETGIAPNAFTIDINVLSALQASFVGTAIDFGEVGDKSDAEVNTIPVQTGYIRVASSGVYSVNMTSQNGYKMTFPGGSLSDPAHTLRYQATFVGQTRSPSDTSAIVRNCGRAGVPLANGQLLPIEAKLLDGGQTRTPAPVYQDYLVVTLTPLLEPQAASSCI